MPNVWVVRAQFGKYTDDFVNGGYVAVGWMSEEDLSQIKTRDEIYPKYRLAYPNDTSNIVIGQQVGQIARFLLEIKAGDFVITPPSDTEWLHFGRVISDKSYHYTDGTDACPYRHRREVAWDGRRIKRSEFSIPFQNTIRSSLTVFNVSHGEELLDRTESRRKEAPKYDPYRVVLDQILQLDAAEFEILIGDLLTALGFESSEVTGGPNDSGVDVKGELNVSNLAKVKLFVQAKRYRPGSKVSAKIVRQFRGSIPNDGQGAFITTADYQSKSTDVALEAGFPRIGLINGHQFVDLLVEHWGSISEEFRDRLGLRRGLVLT